MPDDPSLNDLLQRRDRRRLRTPAGGRSRTSTRASPFETKADNTPVTCADREAEEMIRATILKRFPTHSILGEEGGIHEGSNKRYRWIIDPIDGTKSFICGVPLYGVLIGVEVDGRPQVGVVLHARAGRDGRGRDAAWAARGTAAVRACRARASSSDAVVSSTSITTALSRSDAFEQITSRAKVTRGWGDCYGHVLAATGRIDVMLDPRMNPWDAAPFAPDLRRGRRALHDVEGRADDLGSRTASARTRRCIARCSRSCAANGARPAGRGDMRRVEREASKPAAASTRRRRRPYNRRFMLTTHPSPACSSPAPTPASARR